MISRGDFVFMYDEGGGNGVLVGPAHVVRVYTGSTRDYIRTRTKNTGHIRLYTNVPRKKAAPDCKRVQATRTLASSVSVGIVVHPHKNSFLCAPTRVRSVLLSVRLYGRLGIRNMIFNYLAGSKSVSIPLVHQLVRATGPLSIAYRHTFSIYHSPFTTLRRLVRLNYSHVLASNRRSSTIGKVPLVTRLIGHTTNHVVVVPKYKIQRGGVTHVRTRAKTGRFRASTQDVICDGVRCQGRGIPVNDDVISSRFRAIRASHGGITSCLWGGRFVTELQGRLYF